MPNKTISVWLKIETGKIALQKRSASNKRFSDVCQATWAGKVEDTETVENAVKRECKEELGADFADKFDFSKLKPLDKSEFLIDGKKWECFNFFGEISEENLAKVKLHKEAKSEFVFADKKNFDKIILFDDQKKVLEKIINLDSRLRGNDAGA